MGSAMHMEATFDRKGRLLTAEQLKYRYYIKTFVYTLVLSCALMIPFVVFEWIQTGHPVFLYYGDYNAQQIPFYRHCVEMVHSGNFGWDWFTDIGPISSAVIPTTSSGARSSG